LERIISLEGSKLVSEM